MWMLRNNIYGCEWLFKNGVRLVNFTSVYLRKKYPTVELWTSKLFRKLQYLIKKTLQLNKKLILYS